MTGIFSVTGDWKDGDCSEAQFNQPFGLAIMTPKANGTVFIYVSDGMNMVLRRVMLSNARHPPCRCNAMSSPLWDFRYRVE